MRQSYSCKSYKYVTPTSCKLLSTQNPTSRATEKSLHFHLQAADFLLAFQLRRNVVSHRNFYDTPDLQAALQRSSAPETPAETGRGLYRSQPVYGRFLFPVGFTTGTLRSPSREIGTSIC